ncbi:MAG: hypothetical protein ACREE3_12895, partial [Stellaceae bacterium]
MGYLTITLNAYKSSDPNPGRGTEPGSGKKYSANEANFWLFPGLFVPKNEAKTNPIQAESNPIQPEKTRNGGPSGEFLRVEIEPDDDV